MVTTVTTTVSMIMSSITNLNFFISFGLAATFTLIAFLIMRELSSSSGRLSGLAKRLDVAVLPLLFVFGLIVIGRIVDIVL